MNRLRLSLVTAALLATASCSSLSHRAESGITIPPEHHARLSIDATASGETRFAMQVAGHGRVSVTYESQGERGSQRSEFNDGLPMRFNEHWDATHGVITLDVFTEQQAELRYQLASEHGIAVEWSIAPVVRSLGYSAN